jgi:hypothetical protein
MAYLRKQKGSGVTDQIAFASEWNLTVPLNSVTTEAFITANLAERPTDTNRGYDHIGASMTQSSGVFSFPVTGVWSVSFQMSGAGNAASRENHCKIYSTIDDDAYVLANMTSHSIDTGAGGNNQGWNCHGAILFGVDDVTNCKVKFAVQNTNGATSINGHADYNRTTFTFIRHGGL